jgi:riboflavin synthase
MFTGIIEATGTITSVDSQGDNKIFWVRSPLSPDLRVDQSVSHDGVCLTIEEIRDDQHRVTAIAETLRKSNLGEWKPGAVVNLERSIQLNQRLDGHLVQGHVDATASCTKIVEAGGSWQFTFEYPAEFETSVIEKGSISLNGISLTVFNVTSSQFEVGIIPYTFSHTNIQLIRKGMWVNLEFDMIGKYINRIVLSKRS